MDDEKMISFAIEQLKMLLDAAKIEDVKVSRDTYSDGTESFDVSVTYGERLEVD